MARQQTVQYPDPESLPLKPVQRGHDPSVPTPAHRPTPMLLAMEDEKRGPSRATPRQHQPQPERSHSRTDELPGQAPLGPTTGSWDR